MTSASRLLPCLAVVLAMTLPCPAGAQEGTDDDEPYLPGLAATYRDGRSHAAARLDHGLTLRWGEAPPDPRLDAGAFSARWQGQLLTSAQGEYRFFVFGSGEVELKVAGHDVLRRQTLSDGWASSAAVSLGADYHAFELAYRGAGRDSRLMVLWSGPDFGLEPVPPRALWHPRDKPVPRDFERGRLLARVLRCGRCHGEQSPSSPAPALDRLGGHVSRGWLVRWLTAGEHAPDARSPRRMPALGLSAAQAEAVADWLLAAHDSGERGAEHPSPPTPLPQGERGERKTPPAVPPARRQKPDAKTGERLFVTLGCLACHTWRDLGAGGWLGGGDLSHVADKRPPDFFAAWLADPARLNRDHRMPVFDLSSDERASLALFLADQASGRREPAPSPSPLPRGGEGKGEGAEGRKLVEQFRCAACHRLPGDDAGKAGRPAPRLADGGDWEHSCLGAPDAARRRPGYRLGKDDARAVRLYYQSVRSERRDGQLLLADHNCLACHAREGAREAIPLLPPLLSDKLTAVVKRYPELAPRLSALAPPALNSVGDKLTDEALADAVARRGPPHRPYLQVRMPRFPLAGDELQALVRHLVDSDRVPPRGANGGLTPPAQQRDRYALAGGRLVSGDGFGCTSCHAVGRARPPDDAVNARGPDLSRLERRVRRPWFDRWVRNPARIVPRMEMPSVQIPVAGVLDGKLDEQLAAVWYVLNLPGFEPPLPNPVRVLRQSGNNPAAEPVVLTDVLRRGEGVRIKPFLVGLANRHNVLFDLEAGALAAWNVGDAARQHTRGKEWFWEPAGAVVLDTALDKPDLALRLGGRELAVRPLGQFVTEADAWETDGPRLALEYRLRFAVPGDGEPRFTTLHVRRTLAPLTGGFAQELSVRGVPPSATVRLRLSAARATRAPDGRTLRLGDRFGSRIVLAEPAGAAFTEDGRDLLLSPDREGTAHAVLRYESDVPVDRFPEVPGSAPAARKGDPVEVAPGFRGERLPLPADVMPTGITWRPDGRLVFCSLKGQVFQAVDTDGDGTEDRLQLLADGLPAPYGVHADGGAVDISAKYALLRLKETKHGRRVETLASGWGYTTDYHDWAVGLPRNGRGEYFLGIPCQQDRRGPDAARFHGCVLRLTPREPTADDPRRFALAPVSAGHRFPMGLALSRDGELFATDNQGNYKPFNELNHVRPGTHFGFVNHIDRRRPAPPRTPSAVNIPHPWTRSVNGICFLDTPPGLRRRLGRDAFGPLEGHLVGCEYDTRRLIRLSVQRVGDTYQGAAYPLSVPPADPQRGFLGPLVCAVSPRGELYVGSIRDSGWGAGANVGEVVRVRIDPDALPCGLAEMRATADGFVLDFFRPVDRERAGRADSYTIQSYRREATPAYGGPDRDRRTERVRSASVSPDGRRVTLRLGEMRAGFVYELRAKNLAPGGGAFHPAEAHYTLQVVPK